MKQDLIRLKNVGVKYERREGRWKFSQFWALKDISFTIQQGEILGVVGRNGSGKSTLMRLLANIYQPDRGEMQHCRPFTASLIALNVGFVAHLSGRDNVVLGAMLLGLDRKSALAIVDDVKEYSELGEFFEQPVITYSSGMKSRLGFSVAKYANPDLILIDEALGTGDERFRKKSEKAIKEKLLRDTSTVVLVSHSPGILRELCSRVIWIENGVVNMQGDPNDVLDAYISAS